MPGKKVGVLREYYTIMFQGEGDYALVVRVGEPRFLHREHIHATRPQAAGDVDIDVLVGQEPDFSRHGASAGQGVEWPPASLPLRSAHHE